MPNNALNKIEHIVVLMMENRSFDNVLGWLYDPGNQPPFNEVPRGQTFDNFDVNDLTSTVPEPSSLVLMSLIAIGLASRRWRRRYQDR